MGFSLKVTQWRTQIRFWINFTDLSSRADYLLQVAAFSSTLLLPMDCSFYSLHHLNKSHRIQSYKYIFVIVLLLCNWHTWKLIQTALKVTNWNWETNKPWKLKFVVYRQTCVWEGCGERRKVKRKNTIMGTYKALTKNCLDSLLLKKDSRAVAGWMAAGGGRLAGRCNSDRNLAKRTKRLRRQGVRAESRTWENKETMSC